MFGKITMMRCNILILLVCVLVTHCQALDSPYLPHDALCDHLAEMASSKPDLVRVTPLAQSAGQRTLWLVRVADPSKTPYRARPAMLVVAGIEGNDLMGTHVAVQWIEDLISRREQDPNVADLLKTCTIYVVPRVNVDAVERFFGADPRWDRPTSDEPFDDDHDGDVDEDGPEDLNQDGKITQMRIKDQEGTFILDPKENRLLAEADALRGEAGQWRCLVEGLDNDRDEQWNEDGPGGVNFNRNFPFDYQFYAPDSGVHQVSETETHALADFVIRHPQIGLVITYGAADNLLDTPESKDPPGRGQPMTAIDTKDSDLYKVLGERYRKTLTLEKSLSSTAKPGTFSDWMYFHRGRLSLAISPWTPDLAMAMFPVEEDDAEADEPNEAEPTKGSKEDDEPEERQEARARLAWFDQNDPDAFVPWQKIDHPDFPGQTVEVGGYGPYALSNPPAHLIDEATRRQGQFLTECAGLLPRITVRDIQVEHLGKSVFDVEIEIENTGFLPTSLSQGQRTREVHPTRLILDLPNTAVLSGQRAQTLEVLAGSGGASQARWIVHCPDLKEIKFEVVSMLAGHIRGTVTLNRN